MSPTPSPPYDKTRFKHIAIPKGVGDEEALKMWCMDRIYSITISLQDHIRAQKKIYSPHLQGQIDHLLKVKGELEDYLNGS